MESPQVSQIKSSVKRRMEEARNECFRLVNPQGLDYSQLSSSEKALFDFCSYLDIYDTETLEKISNIISKTFYG